MTNHRFEVSELRSPLSLFISETRNLLKHSDLGVSGIMETVMISEVPKLTSGFRVSEISNYLGNP
jgi:hypothetical protein